LENNTLELPHSCLCKKMYQYTTKFSTGKTNTAQHKGITFMILFMLKQELE